ncbi:hypothetical protein BDZ91DRAFT_845629 [Kalaharituber pfeilii]|nr:hypothetical protein BDZ91DRAFT_845629 [Kalaharituber pfeilii]
MSVRIELDNRGSVFTCLDTISGRIVFHVPKESSETVTSIIVKLEGISETKLLVPKEHRARQPPPRLGNDSDHRANADNIRNKKPEVEIHKVLYKTQQVFPPPELAKQTNPSSSSNSGYTLSSGIHTYPFKFRIPVNNVCEPLNSIFQKFRIEKGNVGWARDAVHHTKTTLPPSLFNLPGSLQGEGGSIKYFVKVTVNKPRFYQYNLRKYEAFVFLPVEPPRPQPTGEIYARREHFFTLQVYKPIVPKKKNIWPFSNSKPGLVVPEPPVEEPRFTIEARLPSPAILAPKEPMGLRILMVKQVPFTSPIVLRQLQLRLLMTTNIIAYEHSKRVTLTIPLFNTSTNFKLGMNIPFVFGKPTTPVGVQMEADKSIWESWALPENISPSFRTCNITVSYDLEVTCGLSVGTNGAVHQIPLVIPVEIFSGIKPSKKLLESATSRYMRNRNVSVTFPADGSSSTSNLNPSLPPRPRSSSRAPSTSNPIPPTGLKQQHTSPTNLQVPIPNDWASQSVSSFPVSPIPPVRSRSEIWRTPQGLPLDAPPPYEDAMFLSEDVDVGVADGPRRQYPMEEGYFRENNEHERDEKRRSRLFG